MGLGFIKCVYCVITVFESGTHALLDDLSLERVEERVLYVHARYSFCVKTFFCTHSLPFKSIFYIYIKDAK